MMTDRRFAQLVREHAGAVGAYARAVAPEVWTADDAVQETFLRAWRYRDSFRASGSFEGWLIRICRHCLVDLMARTPIDLTADFPQRPELLDIPIGTVRSRLSRARQTIAGHLEQSHTAVPA